METLPQLIYVCLAVAGITLNISKNGETKNATKYNGWASIIVNSIMFALLYWGGFFNNI